jgi:hypothetical protein
VIYDRERCLGGAVIESTCSATADLSARSAA